MPKTTYNTRAPAMWEIISAHVDFKYRTVVDYGFGYGDMLLYAHEAGARRVRGITDKNHEIRFFKEVRQGENHDFGSSVYVFRMPIENILKYPLALSQVSDISICFSVLPYLEHPTMFLEYLYMNHETTLIECQYAGDGPGLSSVENDEQMRYWLIGVGWKNPVAIGKTLVEDRNKYRTIWKCEK